MKKRLLIVVNSIDFFISHRLPLAIAAQKEGYEVHVAARVKNSSDLSGLEGFNVHNITFVRSGQNPLSEIKIFFSLLLLFFNIKPDLIHLVTIKPVIYGGIAAKIVSIKSVVVAISGLGSVFSASGRFEQIRLCLVKFLYRLALKHDNMKVIFQNSSDKEKLLSIRAIKQSQAILLRGSGVSLLDYPNLPEPEGIPVVSMAARLLREKGVCEFVGAARILKERGVKVIMQLIGSPDPENPSSITEKEASFWAKEGIVDILGYRKDIATLYSQSNIVCLPSYYGEGLPKSLIEGAACGRAVITTDMPGCRDAIIPNVTGLLVPARNEAALADSIETLINDTSKRRVMGEAARKLAEDEFTIEHVIEKHMNIYQELLSRA